MKKFYFFISFFFTLSLFCQQDFIEGTVFDEKTKKPLIGAQVFVPASKTGTVTDIDGRFKLPVQNQKTRLIISYLGYESDTLLVEKNQHVHVFLKEKINSIKTVNVVGFKNQTTELAVIHEIKKSESNLSVISQETIQKNKDNNASQVVRRLPGILLQENKFVFVRGIPFRYNVTLLNGVIAPSFETDKQVFSLDILPSSLIEKITVYKSASPELPGNFSGGVVLIDTKQQVDSSFISTSIAVQGNTQTTFNSFQSSTSAFIENLGFLSSSRKLPKNFPATLTNLTRENNYYWASQLPNTWQTKEILALPDYSMNFTLGEKRKIKENIWYFISLLGVGSSHYSKVNKIYNYNMYDIVHQKSDSIYAYDDHVFQENHQFMFMQNVTSTIKSMLFNYKGVYVQQNSLINTFREGKNFEEGYQIKGYNFKSTERSLLHNTLKISQQKENSSIESISFLAFSFYNQPDDKRIRTVRDLHAEETTPYVAIIAPSPSVQDAGRLYQNMHETSFGTKLLWDKKITSFFMPEQTTIKMGAGFDQTLRQFQTRWMSYTMANSSSFDHNLLTLPITEIFAPTHFNDYGFKLQEGTNPSDKYVASQTQAYSFLQSGLKISELSILGGLRIESVTQNLSSKNYSNEGVEVHHSFINALPSALVKWEFSNTNQLKLSYFSSVNYPTFRELAPFSYYDFTTNNVIFGNPSLKNANINNFDLRWEYFPSLGNFFALGIFYQYFKKPIEMYFVPGTGSGGTRNFTFNHAEKATNVGAEGELTYKIKLSSQTQAPTLQFISNIALIHSEVTLNKELAVGQNSHRPLLGQASFIANVGTYFQTKLFSLNVLYNTIGKRVYAAGTYGTPDIYEMPKHSIDANVQLTPSKNLSIGMSARNLLNLPYLYKQDSNMNNKIDSKDELILKYKTGIDLRLDISYRF